MEQEIKINNVPISQYSLIGSYDKARVIETEQLTILISYESYILIYYKPNRTLIYNIKYHNYSNTTGKHERQFINNLGYINHKIYLDNKNFMDLINTFYNFGSIENKFNMIFKNYELELKIIESELYNLNYNKEKGFYFINNSYYPNLNICYGTFKTTDKQEINIYKTVTKEKYFLTYTNELNNELNIMICLTYNKNKTKLKQIELKLISFYGLSFIGKTNHYKKLTERINRKIKL